MRDIDDRGLLYITENSNSFEYQAFARALGTQPVGIRDVGGEHLRLDPNVVFDVDLRATSSLRKLKGLLARRGTGCRIFMVDPKARIAVSNAESLGADAILEPRCGAEAIHQAIRQHHGIVHAVDVTRSIDAGISALDGGFRSLVRDAVFDTEGMESASGQIIDAIDSAGVDHWMATVRGYHVGTFQHCMLVTATASSFARRLGMRRGDVIKVTAAALVHDIGKSAVPVEILDKNGPLTPEEAQTMRSHPIIGHDYLARRSRIAADALRSVRSHHEYLDGSGYPDGLRGDEIDDITRLVTISDIYAALVERRAYKAPKRPEDAIAVLEALAGAGKLEPALVRAFARITLHKQAA
ncbi:HDIG domain-containing protein [Devosia lucknowensis]|uniref:HDIG domain-containing protein n=1 Tax=Devosia lucknowensis TaxID=1096929 RepID=A0A1Y6G816_9HYPH|nr:HD domain-containing phosphohydrolase [Devosia lucknowensis]SMQ86246.1 HDIG domain-containing protein [Devosia lucknowensis]